MKRSSLALLLALAACSAPPTPAPQISAPTPPRTPFASPGIRSAEVSWTAPVNTGGEEPTYEVTLEPDAPGATLTVSGLTAKATGLSNGSTVRFSIVAVNSAGKSDKVTTGAVTTFNVPDAPTAVSAMAVALTPSVTVNWSAPAKDNGSPITGYVVTTTGPTQPGSVTFMGTAATVVGLQPGGTYRFSVAAVNAVGSGTISADSNAVTIPTGAMAPSAPSNAMATATVTGATVTWTASMANGSPVTGYQVTPVPAASGATVTFSTATSATVTGLARGTPYSFEVVALSAAGNSAKAMTNTVTTFDVPGAPTAVTATAQSMAAQVSWTAPASNGGAAITGYKVRTAPAAVGVMTATGTSTTVSGLSNGTAYTFFVRATNALGDGPESASSNAVTPTATLRSLTVAVSGNGSVTSTPGGINCPGTCSFDFASGAAVTLDATPAANHVFTGWGGACSGTAACQLTLNAAQSVTAAFAPAFVVASSVPATGATQVNRIAPIDLTFSSVAAPATVTTNSSNSTCSGSVQLSKDDFVTCVRLQPPTSSDNRTFRFFPASALDGATAFKLRVTTAAQSATSRPLDAPLLATFTTRPALAATAATMSASPATSLAVDFNQAATGVTVSLSGAACSGAIQLSKDDFATCVPFSAQPTASNGNTRFTLLPAKLLSAGSYKVRVATGPVDGTGLAVTPGTFPAQAVTSPEVTGLAITDTQLHALTLGFTQASFTGANGVRLSRRSSGSTAFVSTATLAAGVSTATATPLAPFRGYDFLVTARSSDGRESDGVTVSGATAFKATAADWLAGQRIPGTGGTDFYLSWNSDTLFAGAFNGTAPLAGSDEALWLAIDVHPAGTTTGEARTVTTGVNDIIWPFPADYVVELKMNGTMAPTARLRTVSSGTWAPFTPNVAGAHLGGFSIPAASLGSPSTARFAFAHLASPTGQVLDVAPNNPTAVDVRGFFASLTSSLAPGASLFAESASPTSGSSVRNQASSLVTLRVSGTPGGTLQISSDRRPFSTTLSNTQYQLYDDGTHGDLAGADGNFTGRFNLGGLAGELLFTFAGEPGFGPGQHRVYTLSGTAESLPPLQWGIHYSATHTFVLQFRCTTGGNPTHLRGSVSELGSWTMNVVPVGYANGVASADVTFTNRDTVAAPLGFKMIYDGTNFEGGSDHTMNDDVLNTRVLPWTAGDGSGF